MKTDDTHELSFITLSAATADVVQWLSKKQNPTEDQERPANRERSEAAKENPVKERADIDRRLREVTARLATLRKN